MSGQVESIRHALAAVVASLEVVRETWKREPDRARAAAARIARSLMSLAPRAGDRALLAAAARMAGADDEAGRDATGTAIRRIRSLLRKHPGKVAPVLVIEDDPVSRKIVEAALRSPTREVLVASDGTQAEAILSGRPVSLIVTDLGLPDIDGRTLLTRIREDPRTRTIPVYVVSGESDALAHAECYAVGADQVFGKPIRPKLLAAAVAAALARSDDVQEWIARDRLTGLPSQVGFKELYERYAALTRRSGEPLSLARLDLDDFRAINDAHGRNSGDLALQAVARILTTTLRASDAVARWHGDEFVVLFPGTPLPGAMYALRKAQEALAEADVRAESGERVTLGFSAGIAGVVPDGTADDAISRAEDALVRAKRARAGTILRVDESSEERRRRVLLVEDDPLAATVIRHWLLKDGFEIHHVDDGEAALELAGRIEAGLVILDLKLPGVDGFEVLRQLREDPRYQDVPVVVVSALGREEDVVRALRLGADEFVPKPFSTVELRARVRRLLDLGPAPVASAGGG